MNEENKKVLKKILKSHSLMYTIIAGTLVVICMVYSVIKAFFFQWCKNLIAKTLNFLLFHRTIHFTFSIIWF